MGGGHSLSMIHVLIACIAAMLSSAGPVESPADHVPVPSAPTTTVSIADVATPTTTISAAPTPAPTPTSTSSDSSDSTDDATRIAAPRGFATLDAPVEGNAAPATTRSLAGAAADHGLLIGSAVDDLALRTDGDYRTTLQQQFNVLTPENAMKWSEIHPDADRYDFAASDEIVDFALDNGMAVRGHALTWHRQVPDWLEAGDFTRDEAIEILRDHIDTVVGRYAGQVTQWDVVNEPLDREQGLRENIWTELIGDDYIELAFEFAHAADPDAELFLNDYDGREAGEKTDRIIDLARRLVEQGTPIHGVGLQFHAVGSVDHDAVAEKLDMIAGLGLEIAMTEVDHRLPDDHDADALDDQADVFGGLLDACLNNDRCNTFVMWGFTSEYSWVAEHFDGYGSATVFDADMAPKPAFDALLNRLLAG